MEVIEPRFPVTPWSLLLRLREGSADERAAAMEEVCVRYWGPVYVFARMSGSEREDAEDLTQELFRQFLRDGVWERVRRERGRLRSFLMGSMKRLAVDGWRRRSAAKRGGGVEHVALDGVEGERLVALERAGGVAADEAFDHAWALGVFREAMEALEGEYVESGRERLMGVLKPHLTKQSEETYREAGEGLGMSEGAVKAAVFQMRERFRGHFRAVVARTLDAGGEVEEEVRYLLTVLRSGGRSDGGE